MFAHARSRIIFHECDAIRSLCFVLHGVVKNELAELFNLIFSRLEAIFRPCSVTEVQINPHSSGKKYFCSRKRVRKGPKRHRGHIELKPDWQPNAVNLKKRDYERQGTKGDNCIMHASLCLFYFFQRGDAEVGPAVKVPIFGTFFGLKGQKIA